MNTKTGHLEIERHKDGRPIAPLEEFNGHLDALREFTGRIKDSRAKSLAKTNLDTFVLWTEQALEDEKYGE